MKSIILVAILFGTLVLALIMGLVVLVFDSNKDTDAKEEEEDKEEKKDKEKQSNLPGARERANSAAKDAQDAANRSRTSKENAPRSDAVLEAYNAAKASAESAASAASKANQTGKASVALEQASIAEKQRDLAFEQEDLAARGEASFAVTEANRVLQETSTVNAREECANSNDDPQCQTLARAIRDLTLTIASLNLNAEAHLARDYAAVCRNQSRHLRTVAQTVLARATLGQLWRQTRLDTENGAYITHDNINTQLANVDFLHVSAGAVPKFGAQTLGNATRTTWKHEPSGNLVSVPDNKCLVYPDRNDEPLRMTTCDPADDRQRWMYNTQTKQLQWKNAMNKCLQSTSSDSSIHVGPCQPNNLQQKWKVFSDYKQGGASVGIPPGLVRF